MARSRIRRFITNLPMILLVVLVSRENPRGAFGAEPYPSKCLSGTEDSPVQFVVLPDGYTQDELGKFSKDANRLVLETLLQNRMIGKYKDKIGVVSVDVPSSASGFGPQHTGRAAPR